MFSNTGITNVTISASVKTISYAAFRNCTSLTDVHLSVTKNEWENNVAVAAEAFPENVTFHFVYNDSENYKVENLYGTVENGKFYAEVEVVNLTDREMADTVVIAVYKGDEMIDFVYMKTDLPKGQTITFGGMLEGAEGATLKAFVWDSLQGMKALSNVVEK